MKHVIFSFLLIVVTISNLQGSERRRPNIPRLDSSLCLKEVTDAPDEKNMGARRDASRAYVTLMQRVLSFQKDSKNAQDVFSVLCTDVSAYRAEHLEVLMHNTLLRDGDSDPFYNPFNRELLATLEKIADEKKFPMGWVPFPVVLEIMSPKLENSPLNSGPSEIWSQQANELTPRSAHTTPSMPTPSTNLLDQ